VKGEIDLINARTQAVLDAESRRCAAISSGDFEALTAMLSEDYLHTHGDGRTGDKVDYIEGVRKAPRVPIRDNLVVRLFGDVAVLTGDLLNTIHLPDRGEPLVIEASATFVLRETNSGWLFVSGQLTPKRAIV
jgi:ketosteroid isomerase-like protein